MAKGLSLEGLRYARAVARAGSFSAAARAYGVTQPALSNGIAKLEEHLGGRLFARSPRGVAPTPFGASVLPLIERTLTALDDVTAEASRWNAPTAENIRMGISPVINPELVARAYRVVCGSPILSTPRQLVLREANLAELRDGLAAGELDVIVAPSVGPLPRYEHRVIDSEPLVLVEAHSDTETPAQVTELAGKQLILMPDTCGLTTFTRDLLAARDVPLRCYPGEATNYQVLEEWSGLGLGAAMLPQSKLTGPAGYRAVRDEDGTIVEIFYEAVWDPHSSLAGDLRALADELGRATCAHAPAADENAAAAIS